MSTDSKWVVLASIGGTAVVAGVEAAIAGVLHSPASDNADGRWYALMADGFRVHIPYAWRVMLPALVRATPLPHWMSFYGVAVVCAALSSMFLGLYALRCGYGRAVALASVFLFLADYWCVVSHLYDPFTVDPIGLLTIGAAFYLLSIDQPLAAAAVAVCGTLDHETSVLLGAAFFGWGWPRWRRALAWGAAVTVATFGVHLLAQALAPATATVTVTGAVLHEFVPTLRARLSSLRYGAGAVVALLTTAWGIGAVLGWGRPVDLWRHLKRPECLAFAVVAIPATFLLGQNGSRLFVYAFPALLPGMALGAVSLLATVRRRGGAWLAGSVVALALMVAMPFGLHAKAGAAALVLGAAGVLWLRDRSGRGGSRVGARHPVGEQQP